MDLNSTSDTNEAFESLGTCATKGNNLAPELLISSGHAFLPEQNGNHAIHSVLHRNPMTAAAAYQGIDLNSVVTVYLGYVSGTDCTANEEFQKLLPSSSQLVVGITSDPSQRKLGRKQEIKYRQN